jgi:NAD+ synthetase
MAPEESPQADKPIEEIRAGLPNPDSNTPLQLNLPLVADWLTEFLHDELVRRRGFQNAVVGVSGGVDSAVSLALAARALGPDHVVGLRLPYRTSSADSLAHAQQVIDQLGVRSDTIDISAAVDGYLAHVPEADGRRCGNVMARMRMIVLFDQSEKYRALPIGTGNKTERLLGYFTWHGDDAPPINPLGDLFKTQVWALARFLEIPLVIVEKHPTADLVVGQTDEADLGITYAKADRILYYLLQGYSVEQLTDRGFAPAELAVVKRRLDATHWKRALPTNAMLSQTAIGQFYLRPVDY